MKIAIFQNFLDNIGGAEVVGLTLARELRADIYTTNIDRGKIHQMGFDDVTIKSIGKVPINAPFRQQMVLARFRMLNLKDKYDFYIINGDWAVSSAINNKPNLWYVNATIREIWDLNKYVRENLMSPLKRPLFDFWVIYNRYLNRKHIRHINTIISNSTFTKDRIMKYIKRESELIYPPVQTKKFHNQKSGNYWLSVNRLIGYKRIDLQLQAFSKLSNEKLVILGPYEKSSTSLAYVEYLKKIKPNNVTILGAANNFDELVKYYSNCKGFITTCLNEDFGITAIEAMASGKAVIAPNEGGYKETIINGKTGILIDNINPEKIIDVINKVDNTLKENPGYYIKNSQSQAAKFDVKNYIERMNDLIDREYKNKKNEHLFTTNQTLKKTYEKYSKLGITSFYIWGSIARDDYRPNKSDIDIIAIVDDSFRSKYEKRITIFARKICKLKKFNINYIWMSELKGGKRHSKMMQVFPAEIFLMNFHEWKLMAGHSFVRTDFIPSNYKDAENIGFNRSKATKDLLSRLPIGEDQTNFIIKACMRMCYFIHRTKHGDHQYSGNTLSSYETEETRKIIPLLLSIKNSDKPQITDEHMPKLIEFVNSTKVSYPNKHLYIFLSEVLPLLEKKGLVYWVIGGVAIAGVAGTFIRENNDLDICVHEEDYEKTKEYLIEICKLHKESWKITTTYSEILKRPIIEIFVNNIELFSVVVLHKTTNGYELRLDETPIKIDSIPEQEKRVVDNFTFYTFPTPVLKKILLHTMELFTRFYPRQILDHNSNENKYWIDAHILLNKKEQDKIYENAKKAAPMAFLIPIDRYIGIIGINIKKLSPKTYRLLKRVISN